jgi:hypothetical protein
MSLAGNKPSSNGALVLDGAQPIEHCDQARLWQRLDDQPFATLVKQPGLAWLPDKRKLRTRTQSALSRSTI